MNTSFSWIKDYVPQLSCSIEEYVDRMTLLGTKVESVTKLSKNLEGICLGRILSVEPHPHADKLVVCLVDVGSRRADGVDAEGHVQIVTGAPNISVDSVGAYVPVVLSGGKVARGHDGGAWPADGISISTGELRGVESYGMLCSIEELGSDKNAYPLAPESGIYIIPDDIVALYDAALGDDVLPLLGMDDTVIEYEITSNRVDCYSVIGIAREAAAAFDTEFIKPPIEESGNGEDIHDYLRVSVEDPQYCLRYVARMVRNIRFAPSPEWMQKRLRNSGIRPINNLVDITNFVMLEYGQPMHAFDYDTLSGHEIVVKCAHDGDQFETLDQQIRHLDKDVLMINDGEKPVGIAGIMGGQNSKITESVNSVVFEAATFLGTNIRRSSKKIGMRTDASSLYEKGLDPNLAMEACNRACELVEELDCGDVISGYIDVYPEPEEPVRVPFEPERINERLGTGFSEEEMIGLLSKLYLSYDPESREFIIPSFRRDIHEMCDLSEEVMRLYGYDKIEETLPVGEATIGTTTLQQRVDGILRDTVEYGGFNQIMTYSFESPKAFNLLKLPKDDPLRKCITIANPLGEDYSVMRTQTVNAMLTALLFNANHKNKKVWLYELANVYIPRELPLTELPDEREVLTLGGFGDGMDFYVMKGMVEDILDHLGMRERMTLTPNAARSYMHPRRNADVYYEGVCIGYFGEIHPDVTKNYKFKKDVKVYITVLDVPTLLDFVTFERRHETVVRYPAVERDFSMLVPASVTAGSIEEEIICDSGELLEHIELFDIYEGDQVAEGFKSMAYNVSLRAKDHTLVEDEIVSVTDRIISGLKTLGIELRS